MSIVQVLAKQNLIAQKNNLQLQNLQNSAMQRKMLENPAFMGSLESANAMETALALDSINNSAMLMSINAELEALSNAKIDYYA